MTGGGQGQAPRQAGRLGRPWGGRGAGAIPVKTSRPCRAEGQLRGSSGPTGRSRGCLRTLLHADKHPWGLREAKSFRVSIGQALTCQSPGDQWPWAPPVREGGQEARACEGGGQTRGRGSGRRSPRRQGEAAAGARLTLASLCSGLTAKRQWSTPALGLCGLSRSPCLGGLSPPCCQAV